MAGNADTGTGVSGNMSTTQSSARGAGTASSSQTAAPSPAASGESLPSKGDPKLNPCSTKSKSKHHKKKTTSLTSIDWLTSTRLSQTQPGRVVAAKLD